MNANANPPNTSPQRQTFTVPKSLQRVRGLEEAIGEVERELGVRFRCFAEWQASGRIDRITASERWERLCAALKFLDHINEGLKKSGQNLVWDPDQNALVELPAET